MSYERIVDIIKNVTGLVNVPVHFSECIGSPYFGIGDYWWDIVPDELIDDPMFELSDFLKNEHLSYYHIGLPDKILRKKDEYIYKVTRRQLKKNGINISLSKGSLEAFIILHEFGHAHHVLVDYNGDLEKYIKETSHECSANSYRIKAYGLSGTEEGLLVHKKLKTEQYADTFAINHFIRVANLLNNTL